MEINRIRQRNLVLLLIAGSGLATFARAMTLSFLAIKLQQSFDLGFASIGALLGVGPLLGAMASPFAGSLSDRVGRIAVLTVSLLSVAGSLLAMGLATSAFSFCVAQIVGAVAIAINEPITRALMSDVCPENRRLTYFSWRYVASNIGWALGPLIAVEAGPASTTLFTSSSAIYLVFAALLVLLRLPPIQTLVADRSAQPSLSAGLRAAVRDPRLAFFIGGGTLLIAVHGQFSATVSPYINSHFERGSEMYAYLVSINGIVVLLTSSLARRFIAHTGGLRALVVGCVFLILSQLGFLASNDFWSLAASMVVFTLGEVLVTPSEYIVVDAIASDRNRGSYFGAHSLSTVGNFIGPALGGAMLGAFGGAGMFLLFAFFAGISAFLFSVGNRMPPPMTTKPDVVASPLGRSKSVVPRFRHALT